MQIKILDDAASVAQRAAGLIASEAKVAIVDHGHFVFAVSGGNTPWLMLRELAGRDLAWDAIDIVQVDERIAPDGDSDRNFTHITESLREAPLGSQQIHAMPVTSVDLEAAAAQYAATLQRIAGSPPEIDLVHLGLGADGHTASLVPGDPVLEVTDRDVAITGTYQGRRRMTLTYPLLARARRIVWVVTGKEKAEALRRLWIGDPTIPAGRVRRDWALILADCPAATLLEGDRSITGNKEGTCV